MAAFSWVENLACWQLSDCVLVSSSRGFTQRVCCSGSAHTSGSSTGLSSLTYTTTHPCCVLPTHTYIPESMCVGRCLHIWTHFIAVYNERAIKLCPKEHLHKHAFLNFSGQTNNLMTRFANFQFSVRSDWEHVSLCRDRVTEVVALALYSDISVAFFFLYKSDFLKRLAEQERFSYTEVMYYANIFLG